MKDDRENHREAVGRPRSRSRLLLALLAVCALPSGAISTERLAPGASSCSECHGSGQAEELVPSLEPFSADEIASALDAFRSGKRGGTIMPRIAKGFSKAEARAIAASLGRAAP